MSIKAMWWWMHVLGVLFMLNIICVPMDVASGKYYMAIINGIVGLINLRQALDFFHTLEAHKRGNNGNR